MGPRTNITSDPVEMFIVDSQVHRWLDESPVVGGQQ